MEKKHTLLFNSIDKFLLIIVSAFLINGFLFWILATIIKTTDAFVWFLTIPVSFSLSYFILKKIYFQHEELSVKKLLPYLLLLVFLLISFFYLLEPALKNPHATFGVPNKNLHDGIAVFIDTYGYPPSDRIELAKSAFIPDSHDGLYLGYPTGLHVVTAFFNKFGFSVFHSSWFAFTFGILVSSLSIFLLSKTITRNNYYSAVIAGLFIFTSLRIGYGVVVSVPMIFSYTLLLPTFLICLLAIHHEKNRWILLLPAIALSFLAASYSGTIVLVIGMILLYTLLLFLVHEKHLAKNALFLLLWSIPLLVVTLFFQQHIYWQNTFPTAIDYDAYEFSQKFFPIDNPLYMIVYCLSFCFVIYSFIKEKIHETNILKFTLFLVNLGLLGLIIYDIMFHHVTGISTVKELQTIDPNGFFGGLNHQKISRLAFLQPFFFIFFLAEFTVIFKNNILKIVSIVLLFACLSFIRLPLTQTIIPGSVDLVYNPSDEKKSYTLLSHLVHIVNNRIWTKDILDGLDYLALQDNVANHTLIWDDRNWQEETITKWGSVYLHKKLLQRQNLNITSGQLSSESLDTLRANNIHYVLLIAPTPENLSKIYQGGFGILWQQGSVLLLQVQ